MHILSKLYHGLIACCHVYSRRFRALDGFTQLMIFAVIINSLLAATIGLPATICLLLVCIIALPMLNADIKKEIDEEYRNVSDHNNQNLSERKQHRDGNN